MYKIGFVFGDQDTIESVIMFRVDGRTIKRGSLLDNSANATRCWISCIAFRPSAQSESKQKIFIENVLRNANLALTCFEKTF